MKRPRIFAAPVRRHETPRQDSAWSALIDSLISDVTSSISLLIFMATAISATVGGERRGYQKVLQQLTSSQGGALH